MSNNKNINRLGVIIIALVLIMLIILTNYNSKTTNYAGNIISKVINPIQNVIIYIKNSIEKNDAFFEDIDELKTKNEELIRQNEELKNKLIEKSLVEAENETLKLNLKIGENYNQYDLIYGNIIEKDISNINSVITINIGRKDGVEPNMVVIAEKGLVGYVISVTDNTSKVQTIIDTASAVSAMLLNTRDIVLCRGILGYKNSLKASYISTESIIAKGDYLETSGMGGIYPKGLRIGEVIEVIETNNIIDRYAIVQTYVDFSHLETVAIIKTKQEV